MQKEHRGAPLTSRFTAHFAAILAGFLLPAGLVLAQAPPAASGSEAPASPKFQITRFQVDGNTLLKPEEVERVVTPFVGAQKEFADIQRALEALEQTYRDRGYGVVQVLLPEQDITRGVVRLRVIEPRIGKVVIEGNQNFNDANVRRSMPSLVPGSTPNSAYVSRNLQMLSEHPAKQTTVLLKAGAAENDVDATIKVVDEKPVKYVVTMDNSGTTDTGRFRTGFAVQNSNLFNRDQILNIQYVTNPEHPSKVQIWGLGYRIPLYSHSSAIELFAGYSDVSSGTLQGLFNVSGSGTILGARFNIYLPKIGEYEHKLYAGLDYRAYQNQVSQLAGGGGLVPDITVHPISFGYSGLWRMTNAELGFYGTYSYNIFNGGNDGADSDFKASRAEAPAGYQIWRAGASYTRVLPRGWQLRAVANGQFTNDALVSGEQFGYGGPDSVRGFNIREVANDSGYSTTLELYTPELAEQLKLPSTQMRLLAFYDQGTVSRNSIQPGESKGQSGGSVGLGLRLTYGKHFNWRLDVAQIVDPAGNESSNHRAWQTSIALPF